jgi:hypothetical protein
VSTSDYPVRCVGPGAPKLGAISASELPADTWILLALVAVAAAIRFLVIDNQSFWADEAGARMARRDARNRAARAHDVDRSDLRQARAECRKPMTRDSRGVGFTLDSCAAARREDQNSRRRGETPESVR